MNYDYLVMDSSRKILADHKVSVTNPRIVVLEALLEIKSPITVDELLSQLRNKVAKSTLYRVLNDLKDIDNIIDFTDVRKLIIQLKENKTPIKLRSIWRNFFYFQFKSDEIDELLQKVLTKCSQYPNKEIPSACLLYTSPSPRD